MTTVTIEQTLLALANVDSTDGVELPLDATVYGTEVADRPGTFVGDGCRVTVHPGPTNCVRLSARDVDTRRQIVGQALTRMLQSAVAKRSLL
jgi:hypothetical protein